MSKPAAHPRPAPAASARRLFLRRGAQIALAAGAVPLAAPAWASWGESLNERARRLSFMHLHTNENLALVYAVGDAYLPSALNNLNHFLRDHYTGDVGLMDPQLFDLLHRVRLTLGSSERFEVISGYRSSNTNETLRTTRGGGVAKRSLHMDGKAIDVRLPGTALADLRDAAMSLQAGGVGFYPNENFVHIDTGRVRSW